MNVRLIRFLRPPDVPMPVYVHTVGYNKQGFVTRPDGFSAHQLLFVRGGQGRVHIYGREEFVFGPQEYMVVPAGLPHDYDPVEEPWEVGYVSFLGEGVEQLLAHFGIEPCQPQPLSDVDRIWDVLDSIWKVGDANGEGAEWEAARLLYGLLLDLKRTEESGYLSNREPVEAVKESSADEVVHQAARYLHEHFNENITLSNVASSLGYTHQYLNRLFRKAYGISMLQYVQRIRLDSAIGLMYANSEISVKDIAGRIGMETNYFIRMFRKATGMTPDQYKKKRK